MHALPGSARSKENNLEDWADAQKLNILKGQCDY